MLRRGFVRAMISAIVAPKALFSQQNGKSALPPPAPVPWTLGLNPKTPLPHTETADTIAATDQRFFTAVQMATVVRLSDVLVPPLDNKPGALQAQAPLFLDFLIGSSPTARQKVYIDGLNWLETQSQSKYKKSFAQLDDTQADSLLKPWLRTWMSDHPPTEPHADFINIAHDDIRTATVNSRAWSDVAPTTGEEAAPSGLFWYPIEPQACAPSDSTHIPPHVLAAPKASHSIPSYPR